MLKLFLLLLCTFATFENGYLTVKCSDLNVKEFNTIKKLSKLLLPRNSFGSSPFFDASPVGVSEANWSGRNGKITEDFDFSEDQEHLNLLNNNNNNNNNSCLTPKSQLPRKNKILISERGFGNITPISALLGEKENFQEDDEEEEEKDNFSDKLQIEKIESRNSNDLKNLLTQKQEGEKDLEIAKLFNEKINLNSIEEHVSQTRPGFTIEDVECDSDSDGHEFVTFKPICNKSNVDTKAPETGNPTINQTDSRVFVFDLKNYESPQSTVDINLKERFDASKNFFNLQMASQNFKSHMKMDEFPPGLFMLKVSMKIRHYRGHLLTASECTDDGDDLWQAVDKCSMKIEDLVEVIENLMRAGMEKSSEELFCRVLIPYMFRLKLLKKSYKSTSTDVKGPDYDVQLVFLNNLITRGCSLLTRELLIDRSAGRWLRTNLSPFFITNFSQILIENGSLRDEEVLEVIKLMMKEIDLKQFFKVYAKYLVNSIKKLRTDNNEPKLRESIKIFLLENMKKR